MGSWVGMAAAGVLAAAGVGVAAAEPTGAAGHRAPMVVSEPVQLSLDPRAEGGLGWLATPLVSREPLDTAPLIDEDRLAAGLGPLRVGIDRPLAAVTTPRTAGAWQDNGDGTWTWRLRLTDPGAVAVRVWFEDLHTVTGETLTIGDATGRYAERMDIASAPPGRSLWSSALPGDTALIELTAPGAALAAEPAFIRVGGTAHLYHPSFRDDPQTLILRDTCNEDVACESPDAISRDAVGRMSYSRNGTQYLCTGALLADLDSRDRVPYFLTAAHCISTQDVADTLTVYWFYQRDVCGGTGPALSSRPRTSGAALLATSSDSDVTLLRLTQPMAGGQGFAAWTSQPLAMGETCAGIHHPGGGLKEYSRGQRDSTPLNCTSRPATNYYYGNWSVGITEGGSSGSPLFDSQWRVVGQLYGKCCPSSCALSDCTNRDQWNFLYGRFDVSFPLLAPFLARCPGDFNGSGAVSVQDIFDFLAAYFAADPNADFNRSGALSVQDLFDFLAAYFGPCGG